MINLYTILQVNETATAEEIKKAYRKLSRTMHPDVNKAEDANERFQDLVEAYNILSDDELRNAYDEQLRQSERNDFAFDEQFAKLVGMLVRRRKGLIPIKGNTYTIPVEVSIEDILREKIIEVNYLAEKTCFKCAGLKTIQSEQKCESCNGEGSVVKETRTPFGSLKTRVRCGDCGGSGADTERECYVCSGRGVNNVDRQLQVKLNKELNFDQQISFKGKGGDGLNGGPNGDVIIRLLRSPEDTKYRIEYGNDVTCTTFVTLMDLLENKEFDIELPDGDIHVVKIMDHLRNPNNRISIPNKGLFGENKQRGSFATNIAVDFSKLTEVQCKQILQILKK